MHAGKQEEKNNYHAYTFPVLTHIAQVRVNDARF